MNTLNSLLQYQIAPLLAQTTQPFTDIPWPAVFLFGVLVFGMIVTLSNRRALPPDAAVTVVSPQTTPPYPYSPYLPVNLVLAFFLGIATTLIVQLLLRGA